jgi:hypothetical protein
VVADRDGKLLIFLDTLAGMDGAIKRRKYIKVLHRDKIGQEFILAYEESKKMLVLCASTKVIVSFGGFMSWLTGCSSFIYTSLFLMKVSGHCKPLVAPSTYYHGTILV